MDESNRLKPMVDGYNVTLFNQIYADTKALRSSLAFGIDGRKFGVDFKELTSWFDVKLLFIFNKYKDDPKVKGYVINGLKMYKKRVLLNSMQEQYKIHNTTDIDEAYDLHYEEHDEHAQTLLTSAKDYLKQTLSDDAYFLFELQLNPPPYILNQLKNPEQKKLPKISTQMIAEFLDMETDEGYELINNLRDEIEEGIAKARAYFQLNPID